MCHSSTTSIAEEVQFAVGSDDFADVPSSRSDLSVESNDHPTGVIQLKCREALAERVMTEDQVLTNISPGVVVD